MANPPVDRSVRPSELRRRFNEGDYWRRAEGGEFQQVVARNGHPSAERSGQPYCTRSQIIECRNQAGQMIAKVHRYLRRDGTLGGSGMPDPKVLVEGGVRYFALEPDAAG
jgi:hypothetical protein